MTNVIEPVGETEIYGFFAWCEGCDSRHYIPIIEVDTPIGKQPAWGWNQRWDTPTFTPSVLIYEYEGHHPRCHSFIRDGMWEYLTDSTHKYAGTTRTLLTRDRWPEETWPNE